MVDINDVKKRSEMFEGTHAFLAEELLVPNDNKNDQVRMNMFTNHLPQALVLDEPDFPNVFTNFENQVGDHSTALKVSDREWTIIKKIKKNSMVTVFILKDKDNNLEIFHVNPAERITEHYGFLYHNEINEHEELDTIHEGETIYRSTSYDKNRNFCYGKNLKVCFLAALNMTYEDGIILSKSAAKKFTANSVDMIDITINNNDVLINLFGDNENYKCFPDVGEVCEKRILCSRRRINQQSLLFDFNSANINKVNIDTDTIFYIAPESTIYDVEVFCNSDLNNLSNKRYYNQIMKYIDMNNTFYKEVVNLLEPYMEDSEYHPSSDVKYYYKRYSDLLNPITTFKYEGNTFDNIVIRIRTYNKNKLTIGSKITNRYGGKGVISAILPDDEMPINEYGEHVDACLNPMGVPSRLNLGQLYELELNFMGDQLLRSIKDDSIEEQYKQILKFYKIVNENQYNFIKESIKTKKSRKQFVDDCYEHGLLIHQPPFFGNITMNQMIKLYLTFGYKPYHCTYKGKDIDKPLIFGNVYYIRLKHDPGSKMSARAAGELSLNNTPSKSSSLKNHTSLFSQTPVRAGEMEFTSFLLTQDIENVLRYISQMSSNPEERQHFIEELLTYADPFNIEKINLKGSRSITSRIVETQLKAIGIENIDNKKEESDD